MKKTLIALAALAATSAFAQSSVSISGSIQYGVARSAAGANTFGALKGDRNFLNFGVVEDLGGGTTATATMQQRFRSETGRFGGYNNTDGSAATTERNAFEQAAIGVNTKDMGALRVGRFTNILGFNSYNLMEDSANGAGTSSQSGRLSAQVQYTSPAINGFQYIYLNAAKVANTTGTATGNGYTGGGLTGATQSLSAHTFKYAQGPIFAQYSIVDGLKGEASSHIGGTYELGGGLKLALGQFHQKDAFLLQQAHKNTSMGVEYKFGAWTTAVMRSTASAQIESTHIGKKEQTGLKAYYNLSKRTSIDTEYSKTAKAATASNGNAYYVGLRHTF